MQRINVRRIAVADHIRPLSRQQRRKSSSVFPFLRHRLSPLPAAIRRLLSSFCSPYKLTGLLTFFGSLGGDSMNIQLDTIVKKTAPPLS